jgi:hypothetical protein
VAYGGNDDGESLVDKLERTAGGDWSALGEWDFSGGDMLDGAELVKAISVLARPGQAFLKDGQPAPGLVLEFNHDDDGKNPQVRLFLFFDTVGPLIQQMYVAGQIAHARLHYLEDHPALPTPDDPLDQPPS